MSTDLHSVTVGGLRVQVVRKDIKNLHLGVYPPNGRVRIAVPLSTTRTAVRLAVVGKLGWIKRQRTKFQSQERQSKREMVSGESHYFLGRRYRLRVVEHQGPSRVTFRGSSTLELRVRPGTARRERQRALHRWYREQLRTLALPLVEKWSARLNVKLAGWGIKTMRTKWGSCIPSTRRVWLNLELVKAPTTCLEYLIVHELAHLLEPAHGDRFVALMGMMLPGWRSKRDRLQNLPLGHSGWSH